MVLLNTNMSFASIKCQIFTSCKAPSCSHVYKLYAVCVMYIICHIYQVERGKLINQLWRKLSKSEAMIFGDVPCSQSVRQGLYFKQNDHFPRSLETDAVMYNQCQEKETMLWQYCDISYLKVYNLKLSNSSDNKFLACINCIVKLLLNIDLRKKKMTYS